MTKECYGPVGYYKTLFWISLKLNLNETKNVPATIMNYNTNICSTSFSNNQPTLNIGIYSILYWKSNSIWCPTPLISSWVYNWAFTLGLCWKRESVDLFPLNWTKSFGAILMPPWIKKVWIKPQIWRPWTLWKRIKQSHWL